MPQVEQPIFSERNVILGRKTKQRKMNNQKEVYSLENESTTMLYMKRSDENIGRIEFFKMGEEYE